MDLNKIIERSKEPDKSAVPDNYIWHCDECEWRGLVQDCPTESEPVGFMDGPWYDQPICPKCGCGVDV